MNRKILFVDDETNILAAYQRSLRKSFDLDTAESGEAGLAAVAQQGPYAVVVSDLRMPGMDGVRFLSRVRGQSPESVRVMLTGQADMQDAIAAVNQGNIFRFLTKPCEPEALAQAMEAGLEQYRLIMAERELLEKTLSGSIKVLTDVLSLVNPAAFSRADRLKRYVKHITVQLQMPDQWQFELAAMLSQIGCVTIPPDTLKNFYAGQKLTEAEREMIAAYPAVGRDLISHIPRLESISRMIARQKEPFQNYSGPEEPEKRDQVELGAQMLKAALSYDELVKHGRLPHPMAIQQLLAEPAVCDPALVSALQTMEIQDSGMVSRRISLFDLDMRMILDEDIRTNRDVLLVSKGQGVSLTLMKSLENYLNRGEIKEEIQVLAS